MEATRSFLFVTWNGGGNIPPVLGLARRLAERGHDVTVLTEPCLQASVLRAGCRFIPFTQHFTRTDLADDIVRDWEGKTPLGSLRRAFDNLMFGPIQIVAEETRDAIREHKPDVVAADLHMIGSLIAAEAAQLPRAVLFHMPEYLPGPGRPAAGPGFHPRSDALGRLRDGLFTRLFLFLLGRYLDVFNETRRAFGLSPAGSAREILDVFHSADLRLIQTCEAFDFPITPAPRNVRYTGPVLDDPDWIESSRWENPWPAGDSRPLVVVSLSSTFQNQRDALQRAITSLDGLDVRGLVTFGPAMADERFDVPQNVVTMNAVPHGHVFPEAAAVITHAGHGTLMRALAHGIPLVCIPMGRDQNDNAARVAARGVGLRLRSSAKPEKIRAAVLRVLTEPSFRTEAQHLMHIITEDAAADRGTRELEGLVAHGVIRKLRGMPEPTPSVE